MIRVDAHQLNLQFENIEVDTPLVYELHEISHLHENNNLVVWDEFSDILKPPPAMMELLRYVRIHPSKFVASVEGMYVFMCSKTHRRLMKPAVRCQEYSPYRKKKVQDSSISRTMKYLDALKFLENCYYLDEEGEKHSYKGADYLICLDLTFPLEVKEKFLKNPELTLKLMKTSVKIFKKKLETLYGGKIGFWANYHIWSSEEPVKCHPHVHINMINIVVTEEGYKRISPYINLALLKNIWKYIVDHVFNINAPVNLYKRYIKLEDKVRLRHRLKYCARSPVQDFFNFYSVFDFKKEDVENKDFIRFVLKYSNRRQTYGFVRKLKSIVGEIDNSHECTFDEGSLIYVDFVPKEEISDYIMKYAHGFVVFMRKKCIFYPIKKRGKFGIK